MTRVEHCHRVYERMVFILILNGTAAIYVYVRYNKSLLFAIWTLGHSSKAHFKISPLTPHTLHKHCTYLLCVCALTNVRVIYEHVNTPLYIPNKIKKEHVMSFRWVCVLLLWLISKTQRQQ